MMNQQTDEVVVVHGQIVRQQGFTGARGRVNGWLFIDELRKKSG
jgi:hypothetical protein